MLRTLARVAVALAASGCLHYSGGIAPSNVPLDPDGYTVIGPAYGIDCRWGILGIIPLSGANETRRAVEQAIQSTPGADALVNVSTDTFGQYWLVISRHCTEVHAMAVQRNP
jgi:hypothetical protein